MKKQREEHLLERPLRENEVDRLEPYYRKQHLAEAREAGNRLNDILRGNQAILFAVQCAGGVGGVERAGGREGRLETGEECIVWDTDGDLGQGEGCRGGTGILDQGGRAGYGVG